MIDLALSAFVLIVAMILLAVLLVVVFVAVKSFVKWKNRPEYEWKDDEL